MESDDDRKVPEPPVLSDGLWRFYDHRRHHIGFDPRKGQIPIRPDQFPYPANDCPSYSERADVEEWLSTLECTHDNDKECVLSVEYFRHECDDEDGEDCDCQYDHASYDHRMIYEELTRHGLPIIASYKPIERLPGHVEPIKWREQCKMYRRLFAEADAKANAQADSKAKANAQAATQVDVCGKHDRQEEAAPKLGDCKCDHCLSRLPCRVQSKRLKSV
jgi:hypothetical protein